MKIKTAKLAELNKLFDVEFNKKYPVISCTAAIIGIIIGVILQSINENVGSESEQVFSNFCNNNGVRSFLGIFFSNFTVNMLIIAFLAFLGFSSIGSVFVYTAPLFKGLGVGSACGYIYSTYLFKGVLYCGLLIFPASIIGFFGVMLACNESIQMSRDILNLIRKNGSDETKIRTDLYALRYAVITAVTALSSLIYAVGSALFFKLL